MLASASVHSARERLAAPAAAAGLCFSALFFSGGFSDAPLVWVGGLALLAAGLLAAAALAGLSAAPRVGGAGAAFLGCLGGLAVWILATTAWSASPERSWNYANRTLVYLAFAVLGALVAVVVPRTEAIAHVSAVLLGALLGWALLAKCVPSLYPDYGRVARLRAPVAYWNELALLCDAAVPVGLWLAARRARRPAVRAGGTLLLFAATVTLLLTYSRVGVVLACLAAAAWCVLDRERVESIAALALGATAGAAAFGVALSLPGIAKDGQTHAARAHDGGLFALVLVLGGAAVSAAAVLLARAEGQRPLAPERRDRLERIATVAAA